MLSLACCQVDYVQAFPQASLNDPVYMKIPQGWCYNPQTQCLIQHTNPAHCNQSYFIKLKRNLYSCKQAAHNWYMHLIKGLKACGFHQSSVDPCLFIRSNCIIVLYTDDCCIFGLSNDVIDALLQDLQEEFILQDQGSIDNFLGIHIEWTLNESSGVVDHISLTQTGLIYSILRDLGLLHDNSRNELCDPANP